TNSETAFPALEDRSLERAGIMPAGGSRSPLYQCADGDVQLLIGGGMFLSTTTGLLDWAKEFGLQPQTVSDIDFSTWTPQRFMAGGPRFLAGVAGLRAVVRDPARAVTRPEG